MRLREQWLTPGELHAFDLNLLCFPYAGAGPVAFRHWRSTLTAFTVRYPEKAETMAEVIEALMQHVAPKLHGTFAFFGHSMGAGVAFEFTRALRREGFPLPAALLVSAATAPQLRNRVQPDLTDEELLETLGRIHAGASERALRILLSRFAPDARLHRRYLYQDEPPFDIPIRAYGGSEDVTVPVARMEPWGAQTTAGFRLRLFAGGHMYLDQPGAGLPATLKDDLDELLPG